METVRFGGDAQTVLIQPVDEYEAAGLEHEFAALRSLTEQDFQLIACRVDDWNRALSPWAAPAVFGGTAFSGGAGDTLAQITALCDDPEKQYCLGGYSLAGLFALWAVYQTDRFAGAAAVSPSVWFPGFSAYLREHPIRTGSVYLSLGDREERTRNPVLSSVGDCIRADYALLCAQGIPCTLEWNKGNHFQQPDLRMAKGFAWLLNRLQKTDGGC